MTDCRQSPFLSLRTSDRCHWCEGSAFFSRSAIPEQTPGARVKHPINPRAGSARYGSLWETLLKTSGSLWPSGIPVYKKEGDTVIPRFSRTREVGACHTACTKLTEEQRNALHWLAIERGLSDYQLTREILVDYIEGRAPARRTEAARA